MGVVEVCGRAPDQHAVLRPHLRSRRPDRFHGCSAAEALEHPLTRGRCLVGIGAADVMVGGRCIRAPIHPGRAVGVGMGARRSATVSARLLHGGRGGEPRADVRRLRRLSPSRPPCSCRHRIAWRAIGAHRGRRAVVAFFRIAPGSAEGPRVERVQAAITPAARPPAGGRTSPSTANCRPTRRSVAESPTKGEGLVIGGRANVLIFPIFDAGNRLKLVQRSAAGPRSARPAGTGQTDRERCPRRDRR